VTNDIALMLVILAATVVLFVTEKVRMDVVALLVLLALVLTGLVTPQEAFSGFASPAVITVWAIFIVSGGLYYTGVANLFGDRLLKLTGKSESRLVALLMTSVGLLSSVMNNVGATAVLMPAAVSVSRRVQINASRLLMPLAFGSLIGGMITLISTPANILVSGALDQAGLQPFSLFDFAPLGLTALVVGSGYMVLVGRRMLPDVARADVLGEEAGPDLDLIDLYRLGERLFRARVPAGSPLIGQTLADSRLRQDYGLSVIAVKRRGETRLVPSGHSTIRRGDILLVEGMMDHLQWAEVAGLLDVQPEIGVDDRDLQSEVVGITEVLLSPHARLVGKTLADISFREKYQLAVLAILREGRPIRTGLTDLPLRFGDTLLVQGPRQSIRILGREPDFVVLGDVPDGFPFRKEKAPLAIGLLGVMLVPVIAGWLPITAAALLAGVLMVLTGCLSMDEAYDSIEWKAVFLVAGSLPLGIAMEKTGTAEFLAGLLIQAIGGLGPMAVMAGLYLLTNALTQFISNAAAVVLIIPIAMDAAAQLGNPPQALLMAVAIAATASFLTPVAHQSNVLVMGPGGYRFGDYFKVGLPLDALIFILTMVIVPLLWPWL